MKRLLPESLSSRLILVFVGNLLLSFVLIGTIVCYFTSLSREKLNALIFEDQFKDLIHAIQRDEDGNFRSFHMVSDRAWLFSASTKDLQYRVLDEHGRVLYSSVPGGRPLAPDGAFLGVTPASFDITVDGITQHIRTHYFSPSPSDARRYAIQMGMSDRILSIMQQHFTRPITRGSAIILTALALLFILMSTIAFFTVRRMLRPLEDISRIASGISTRHLQQRLPLEGTPVELHTLLHSFNDALERLEKGFNEQQDFLAATAHELKTPLALLRGEIELAEDLESRPLLLEDIDQISRHVHQLLNLAEVREQRNFHMEEFDLSIIVRDVSEYLNRQADRAGVSLRLVNLVPRILRLDRSATFVLLKNLTENAIQHSPPGKTVSLCLGEDDLRVVDEGNGILPQDLPHLFDRFWRSASRRSAGGAGIGLTICQEVARAQGWKLTAENQRSGATFFIRFGPAIPSTPD